MSTLEEAQKYYDAGEHKEAIRAWTDLIDSTTDPDILRRAYSNRSASYWIEDNYIEAVMDAERSIKIDPSYPFPYFIRANCYRAMGRYEEARADYWRALEKGKDQSVVYYHLGHVSAKLNDKDDAINHFTKALQLAAEEDNKVVSRLTIFALKELDIQDIPPENIASA